MTRCSFAFLAVYTRYEMYCAEILQLVPFLSSAFGIFALKFFLKSSILLYIDVLSIVYYTLLIIKKIKLKLRL